GPHEGDEPPRLPVELPPEDEHLPEGQVPEELTAGAGGQEVDVRAGKRAPEEVDRRRGEKGVSQAVVRAHQQDPAYGGLAEGSERQRLLPQPEPEAAGGQPAGEDLE